MGDYTPQSRSEEILYDTIHSLEYTERPQSRVEALLLELKEVIEGGSGTTDYDDLENKPSINNVELSGDKSLADLGVASEEAVAEKASQSDIAPTFSDATAYTVRDVVYYDGSLYRFTADHSAGAWDSADVEHVTVDDLVDGLKPVDSVTDGDMRPVTSNAVYDAMSGSVAVRSTSSETIASALNRLAALADFTKINRNSTLSFGGALYIVSSKTSNYANFYMSVPDLDGSYPYLLSRIIHLEKSNSSLKTFSIRTTGTGTDLTPTVNARDDSSLTGSRDYIIYYR